MSLSIGELQVGAAASSKSDVYLSLTTKRAGKIKGEVTTEGHEDDIGIYGWSWGVQANTAIGATAATARRAYKGLVLLKGIDAASTGLMSVLVSNDEVRDATLTMRKAGGDALDYFTMKLGRARVLAVDLEVGTNGIPVERVSIAFGKIDIAYQRQQAAGISSGGYSFNDDVLPTE